MGDGLLSGLGSFGLDGLEGMSLFEEEKKEEAKKAAYVPTEKDYLLEKTQKCPICDTEFKTKAVKAGKAKLLRSDKDLRPVYQDVDIAKYDVIMCPKCGYTALSRYFPSILNVQAQKIKAKITPAFKPKPDTSEIYTYDEAIERYKMALVNAIVKGGKASEKAYICLKASWMARGKAEEIGEAHADYQKTKAMELEFSKNAFDGFVAAVQGENFPMCGMDEMTINYLIAVLGTMTGHMDVAQKMIANILQAQTAGPRIKDLARDLKDEILNKGK